MQSYIFLDLDDTLFQTLRKCGPDTRTDALQVRAFLPDGTPNSFATDKQQWLWQWLSQGFKVVPVTARDVGAFGRVNLPFQEEVVLDHGAVILDKQRELDTHWLEAMVQALPDYHDKFFAVWEEVIAYAARHDGFKPRLVNDFGVTWYGYVKHSDAQEATLRRLLDRVIKPHAHVVDGSLYWHINGNNLALLPKIINKENAVGYLLDKYRQRHPELITFAAGDSNADAPFMGLCDYALIPKNTQLFHTLAQAI